MRWRWIDRIVRMDLDGACAGVKAVSLEEYALGEPLGRRGALPETLAMECAVALARWSIIVTSDFTETGAWFESLDFSMRAATRPGDRIDVEARPLSSAGDGDETAPRRSFAISLGALGDGTLTLRRGTLADYDDPAALRALYASIGPLPGGR